MEPANVNPNPAPDDVLDLLLQRSAPPPLHDDGFSTRVLAALPVPAAQSRRLRTMLIVLAGVAGAALAAAGIVAAGGPSGISLALADRFAIVGRTPASTAIVNGPGFGLAIVTTVVSLLYAFRQRPARRRTSLI